MSKERKRAFIFLAVFIIVLVGTAAALWILQEPKDTLGNVGPWYSDDFLEENPQYKSDMGR